MTEQAIKYLQLKETVRANKAKETETARANKAQETLSQANLDEVVRSHKVNERISIDSLLETKRSNLARETLNAANLDELIRSNKAREYETHRANIAREVETNRSNIARETETTRANIASEVNSRYKTNLENLGYISQPQALNDMGYGGGESSLFMLYDALRGLVPKLSISVR